MAVKRTLSNSDDSTGSSHAAARKDDVAGTSPTNKSESVKDEENMNALGKLIHYTLGPLLLMTIMPNLKLVIFFTIAYCGGSLLKLVEYFMDVGLVDGFAGMWAKTPIAGSLINTILVVYVVWAVLLIVILPGERYEGPTTVNGNTPVYYDNGFRAYVLTTCAYLGTVYYLHGHGVSLPKIISDNYGNITSTLDLYAFIFCLFLYVKGRYFPSSTDSGLTGNFIFDFYWGTEQYPRIFNVDIKLFTNCRFGLIAWPLLVWTFALRSYELHGFVDSVWVSATLQLIYISKFFWWEAGYMRTMDIAVDRAGFMICWGCLVYVPAIYAVVSFYLLVHPVVLGPVVSLSLLLCGVVSIYVNYDADWQKLHVRETQGNTTIWGKKPKIIRAKYKLHDGRMKDSLLLVCGWWGVSRHFHYIPEILLSLFWSLPAGFALLPYYYVVYLTILLVHRALRDEEKCSKKYGRYWEEYCKDVPYIIVPGVF